jgi:hypothetical protein
MSLFYRKPELALTEVFIETGTDEGRSTIAAVQEGYSEVHTIEVNPEIAKRATKTLGQYPSVTVHHGSSPEELLLLIDPRKTTTFWLDAHFSGRDISEQDLRYGECPLLFELDAIHCFKWDSLPVIAIDDAHMFVEGLSWDGHVFDSEVYDRKQWPRFGDIARALGGRYKIEVEQNVIWATKL